MQKFQMALALVQVQLPPGGGWIVRPRRRYHQFERDTRGIILTKTKCRGPWGKTGEIPSSSVHCASSEGTLSPQFGIKKTAFKSPFLFSFLLGAGFKFFGKTAEKKGMTAFRSFILIASFALVRVFPVFAGDRLPYRFTPPEGWVSVQAPGVDGAWGRAVESSISSKTTSILVHTKKNDRPFQPKGVSAEKLVEIVHKTRGYFLRLSGLSDWTIDESKLEELSSKKGYRLQMKGHYWGVEDQAVDFVEWAYFTGERYYQVTFHQPGVRPSRAKGSEKNKALGYSKLSEEQIQEVLSRFQPEGL